MYKARTILIHEYVTGGGLAGQDLPESWAREGRAMRRAIAADFAHVAGVRVRMTLDERFPDEPGPWTTRRIGAGQEHAALIEAAHAGEGVLVIAPESDGILFERAEWIENAGGYWLGSSSAGIRLAADKLAFANHLIACGIVTPPCDPRDRSPFPLVLKPRDGAGSIATELVQNERELTERLKRRERSTTIVQPFITGTPMSASFLVDRDGTPRLVGVGRQMIGLQSGQFHYLGGEVPAGTPAHSETARQTIIACGGLRGWVGVDFIWDERGRAVILEINPRLTTSYVGLRTLLPSGELAQAWLDAFDDPENLDARGLANRVHAQPPRRFTADGSIHEGESSPLRTRPP